MRIWRWIIPLAVVATASLLPVPSGLTPHAMGYFALFAGVIAALIVEPLPAAAVGFVGMAVAAATRLVVPDAEGSLRWALSGFANGTVWLVFAAFVLAQGYEKTGLGRRIALQLVRTLGGNTLGLGYAIMLAEVTLAPFTPSNTARSAGAIYPVLRNIPPLYGSQPSMFVTALAPNLLAVGMVADATGQTITMSEWVKGFLPMAAVLVASVPWLVYKVYPPEVKHSREVPVWAAGELQQMGPVTAREWQMGALSIVTVLVWVFGGRVLEPTTVALIAIALMLLLGIVSWDDVAGNRMGWSTLVLLATLVALADGMNKVGFVAWLARAAAQAMSGLPALVVMGGLVALFFLVHYFFASLTAHTTAVLPVLLAAGVAVPGMPIRPFVMLACYSLGMMGVITPYATGPAPVYYATGYISRRAFWSLGLFFGLFFLAVLLGIGAPYLLTLYP